MPDFSEYDSSMELAWQAAEHLVPTTELVKTVPAMPQFLQADTLRKRLRHS
jgi:hypothetical protein